MMLICAGPVTAFPCQSQRLGEPGYGFAYATATDAVCVIAKDVQMVNGNLSTHFGPDGGNLQSDIFHKAILTDAKRRLRSAAK